MHVENRWIKIDSLLSPTAKEEAWRSELKWRTGPAQRNAAVLGTTYQGEWQSANKSCQLYFWQVWMRLKHSCWKLELRLDLKVGLFCPGVGGDDIGNNAAWREVVWCKKNKTKRNKSDLNTSKDSQSMMRPGCINSVRERDGVWRREKTETECWGLAWFDFT